MQAGSAAGEEGLAQARDYADAEVEERCLVAVQLFEAQADPARQISTAAVAEAHGAGTAGDGHDARDDGNRDAGLGATLQKVEVGVGIVKKLGESGVGAGFDL